MWSSHPPQRVFPSEKDRAMSKKQTRIAKLVPILFMGALLVSVVMFRDTPVAKAHIVPSPCDFTTGRGFVLHDRRNQAHFGLLRVRQDERCLRHVDCRS